MTLLEMLNSKVGQETLFNILHHKWYVSLRRTMACQQLAHMMANEEVPFE